MIHDRTRPLRPSGRVTMTTLASIAAAGIAVALGAAPGAPVKDGQATVTPDLLASVKATLGLTAGTIVGLDLDDRVFVAIDAHVQADVEVVLMDHSVEVGRHDLAPTRRLAVIEGAAIEHAGQLGLELDGAGEIEVPEDAAVIIGPR